MKVVVISLDKGPEEVEISSGVGAEVLQHAGDSVTVMSRGKKVKPDDPVEPGQKFTTQEAKNLKNG